MTERTLAQIRADDAALGKYLAWTTIEQVSQSTADRRQLLALVDEWQALLREMEDWLRPEVVKEPDRTFFWKINAALAKVAK